MSAAARSPVDAPQFLPREQLNELFTALRRRGYELVGPVIRQGAIVYDHIETAEDLPCGWTDHQEAGKYRLERREDQRYFGYVVGPQSWKQYLFPPVARIATATATEAGWEVTAADAADAPRYAFIGVRACELAAIAVQDRVFIQKDYADPIYKARRERAFFLAVNCAQSAPTCFCSSMGTGPECGAGYDLALTELDDGFTVEVGSSTGEGIVQELALLSATDEQLRDAEAERRRAIEQQTRSMRTDDVHRLLLDNPHHPRWSETAERCLSCTNCTQVCPTCFCSSVREVADLDVAQVERRREWDSCFNFDFRYMNGGVVRNSVRSRYRQWLTHKLATWQDQFAVSGCVGCGRCITWCPVGIDLTEEVAVIRGSAE